LQQPRRRRINPYVQPPVAFFGRREPIMSHTTKRHPRNLTRCKTLDAIAADPRVLKIWREDGGLSLQLAHGWNFDGQNVIIADYVGWLTDHFSHVTKGAADDPLDELTIYGYDLTRSKSDIDSDLAKRFGPEPFWWNLSHDGLSGLVYDTSSRIIAKLSHETTDW